MTIVFFKLGLKAVDHEGKSNLLQAGAYMDSRIAFMSTVLKL